MKIIQHIKQARKTLFSFEILPPKKGENIQDVFQNIEPLIEFHPPFIDVTYHREEIINNQTVRKRPGTVGICAALMNRFKVDAVPHIICGGFTAYQTEEALIDLDFLGIDNILVLRGDPAKGEKIFQPTNGGYRYAHELLKQIKNLNEGIYLDENQIENTTTNFCMGVAGYPEKHLEASSLEQDLIHLKQKVDAGADYIVTQMFFDNQYFFDFVKKCREIGITVPIIPGIKPLAVTKHLELLPQFFHLQIPEALRKAVLACKDNKAVRQIGQEWAIEQCKELMQHNVAVLHFYSMGKADNIYNIAKAIF